MIKIIKRLCDGGFYAQRTFKTAIAKPVLYDVVFSKSDGKTQFEKLY